jgi:hypothetical protein
VRPIGLPRPSALRRQASGSSSSRWCEFEAPTIHLWEQFRPRGPPRRSRLRRTVGARNHRSWPGWSRRDSCGSGCLPGIGGHRSGAEIEADLARLQLQSCLERLSCFRLKALEHGGPALSQECLGGADADAIAGDRFPDREFASLAPAATAVGFFLFHDLGPAKRARAEGDRREARRRCRRRCRGGLSIELAGRSPSSFRPWV